MRSLRGMQARRVGMLAAVFAASVLGVGPVTAWGQSAPPAAPPPTPAQGDNPFPGEAPAAPKPQAQQPGKPETGKPAAPDAKPGSDNPFPGEDTAAPILPTGAGDAPTPSPRPDGTGRDGAGRDDAGTGSNGAPGVVRRGDDPDGDPVRTPDPAGLQQADDGFSSSRSGMSDLPAEDTTDARPGKSVKNKTREQLVQEDVDVGGFYIEKRNWKAAEARFTAAFVLDRESADAVWGLAEAERHLQKYQEAAEHYKLFLSYDPDGPHGKAARKGLEEMESSLASGARKEPVAPH